MQMFFARALFQMQPNSIFSLAWWEPSFLHGPHEPTRRRQTCRWAVAVKLVGHLLKEFNYFVIIKGSICGPEIRDPDVPSSMGEKLDPWLL